MLRYKSINPKWLIIILALILSLIISNKNIQKTICEEQYQIVKCPNSLYLDSYILVASDSENAIIATKNILEENNFNADDYEIIIDDKNIKIIEKEEKKKAEEETGNTTIQDNNLIIKNENIEFNNEEAEETTEEEITAQSFIGIYTIVKVVPQNLKILENFSMYSNTYNYNNFLNEIIYQANQQLEINNIQDDIQNYDIVLKDNNGKVVGKSRFENENFEYLEVEIEEKGQGETEETITETTTEEGGNIENEDIKDIKEINICICILLAISILYNFICSLFENRK